MHAGGVAAVVLAAGASSRFGSPKTLAHLWGRPLLLYVLDAVAAVGIEEVVVVLGYHAEEIERSLPWRSQRRVRNPAAEAGLSSSLRVGLENVSPGREAALILLGDQPLVRVDVIEGLLAEHGSTERPIVVPRYHDGGGPNPLLVSRAAWPLAREAHSDRGLGPILRKYPDLVTQLDFDGSNQDIDTPDELAAMEAARGRRP